MASQIQFNSVFMNTTLFNIVSKKIRCRFCFPFIISKLKVAMVNKNVQLHEKEILTVVRQVSTIQIKLFTKERLRFGNKLFLEEYL